MKNLKNFSNLGIYAELTKSEHIYSCCRTFTSKIHEFDNKRICILGGISGDKNIDIKKWKKFIKSQSPKLKNK